MKLIMLGTASMCPTKDRNVTSIYLEYNGAGLLFDCGEGTQRQMNIHGLNRNKIKHIFISHWHGDHVSGLIGLIQTVSNQFEDAELNIYGPSGTKDKMSHLMQTVEFETKMPINIHEIEIDAVSLVLETDEYFVSACPLYHSVPTLGYSFTEKDKLRIDMKKAKELGLKPGPAMGKLTSGKNVKVDGKEINFEDVTYLDAGKKATIILDTAPTKHMIELAQNSDVLISESTHTLEHKDKAELYRHMTSTDAATLAQNSGSKKLILTHFSQRYKDLNPMLEEAKDIFPNTELAYDFMTIKF